MNKRIVNWKPVRSKDIHGQEFPDPHAPALIAMAYRGSLIDQILKMPTQEPISFEQAVVMASSEADRSANNYKFGNDRGHSRWFYANFVTFISEQGFHIELTGDEIIPPTDYSC